VREVERRKNKQGKGKESGAGNQKALGGRGRVNLVNGTS
jgi:hypothetical protein